MLRCEASAKRLDDTLHAAVVSSDCVTREKRWKLIFHSQIALDEDISLCETTLLLDDRALAGDPDVRVPFRSA